MKNVDSLIAEIESLRKNQAEMRRLDTLIVEQANNIDQTFRDLAADPNVSVEDRTRARKAVMEFATETLMAVLQHQAGREAQLDKNGLKEFDRTGGLPTGGGFPRL